MAAAYPHPVIAREGWPYLGAAVLVAALATALVGWLWASPLWLGALFVLQFFRDPPRPVPDQVGVVLAPADGRIVAVGTVRDPYLERDALKISVFMNVFNVHSNRSPVAGRVENVWYAPGTFLNASFDKASLENERNALWIKAETEAETDVVCVQIAGLVARRILCYAKRGDRLTRGQRFGFIRFGSRVDLYLPLSARVTAVIGDKVYAAESIVAQLSPPPAAAPA